MLSERCLAVVILPTGEREHHQLECEVTHEDGVAQIRVPIPKPTVVGQHKMRITWFKHDAYRVDEIEYAYDFATERFIHGKEL
jgi:hypothetical protein